MSETNHAEGFVWQDTFRGLCTNCATILSEIGKDWILNMFSKLEMSLLFYMLKEINVGNNYIITILRKMSDIDIK